MRRSYLLLVAACTAFTIFACNAVEAVTMMPSTMISTDAVRSTRLLRGYDVSGLGQDEERGVGAIFDKISTKLSSVTKGTTKKDEVIKITSWAKNPAIDNLINPANISSAMKDITKRNEMFTSWAKFPALSDGVVTALSQNPENKKVLEAFKKFMARVEARAKSKSSTRSIEKALTDYRALVKLFKSWNKNEAVSDVIVTGLTKNFKENEKILLAYSDYRTKLTYGETFDGWVRMMDLKTVEGAINSDTTKVNKIFRGWYAEGNTEVNLKAALGYRQTEFKNVINKYADFVKQQARQDRLANLAKRVADENIKMDHQQQLQQKVTVLVEINFNPIKCFA